MLSIVLALALVLVVLLLAHGLAMGPHHVEESGCATCVAVILAFTALALLLAGWSLQVLPVEPASWPGWFASNPVTSRSRHPPDEGTVLRL